MNLKEMKKKLEHKNYEVVFKQKKSDKWSLYYRPNDLTWRNDFDYKLIHSKHKRMLEEYLKNGNKNLRVCREFHKIDDFIEGYNENVEYLIVQ